MPDKSSQALSQDTFNKKERLKSKKLIELLFKDGRSVNTILLKMTWMPVSFEMEFPVQIGFAVSKRNFRRAVDRNHIKRLIRESWRLQKHELYQLLNEKKLKLVAMLIFTGKKKPVYKEVSESVASIIQRLKKSL